MRQEKVLLKRDSVRIVEALRNGVSRSNSSTAGLVQERMQLTRDKAMLSSKNVGIVSFLCFLTVKSVSIRIRPVSF